MRASPTSRTTCTIPSCASGCARPTAPRASGSSSRPTSTTRSSSPTPSSSPRGSSASSRGRAHPRRRAARARRARARDRLQGRRVHATDAASRVATGTTLDQVWAQRPNAYLSISIPDFPNFFMLNGPNGPVGNFSLIEVAELQFAYIMQLVERLRTGQCREISASREAMDDVRGRPHRGREEDGLGHRVPQLVPRRPRHPGDVAVVVRPLPGGDARARARQLRTAVARPVRE